MTRTTLLLSVSLLLSACAATRPGTHVELRDKDGQKLYIAGAAGQGMNRSIACRQAVLQAVGAIADRFADEAEGVGDDVAEEVGAENGAVFLTRYAKATALESSVLDERFDPIEHLCLVTVTWQPPIFIKDALRTYADALKAKEAVKANDLAGATAPPPAAGQQGAATAAPAQPSGPASATGTTAAPVPPVVAAPQPREVCVPEKAAARKAGAGLQQAEDDFTECMRRAGNDENICHRYKLYLTEARDKEATAQRRLARCKSTEQ